MLQKLQEAVCRYGINDLRLSDHQRWMTQHVPDHTKKVYSGLYGRQFLLEYFSPEFQWTKNGRRFFYAPRMIVDTNDEPDYLAMGFEVLNFIKAQP